MISIDLALGRVEGWLMAKEAPGAILDDMRELINKMKSNIIAACPSPFIAVRAKQEQKSADVEPEPNIKDAGEKFDSIEDAPIKKPRKPLSEETKKKLRIQLAAARENRLKKNAEQPIKNFKAPRL